MLFVYGLLAGIGLLGALSALVWASRRDRARRARIKALEADVASSAQHYQAQLTLLQLELKQDAINERDREIAQLQERVAELLPATRRDRLQLVHRDIGEADLFGFVKIRDELLEAAEMAAHYAARAAFVANGGRPDEFPHKGEKA